MNIKLAFAFIAGAAIGSAVTWKIVKTKYERIANEEIASVKEVFSRRAKDTEVVEHNETTDEVSTKTEDKPTIQEIKEYVDIVKNTGYNNDAQKGGETTTSDGDPYTIMPEEVGVMDGYDLIDLTYYADGVLEDENYEVVVDVAETVGVESLDSFGEYDDDVVFVRNDKRKTDYEIVRDPRNYSDVVRDSPFRARE